MSDRKPCMDCGEPLAKLYPNAAEHLAWAHTSLVDAELCVRDKSLRPWPMPVECGHAFIVASTGRCLHCGHDCTDLVDRAVRRLNAAIAETMP